ncbi:glycosyltransferase family 4 protein [bacterium]|nr:glycosyltransferase family 4 protein [bacterium]
MKVLYVPNWSKSNPYLNLLTGSLKKKGIEPAFGVMNVPFAILKSIKYNWKPNILHIHWPDPYLLRNSIIGRQQVLFNGISFISELIIARLLGIKIVWTVHELTRNDSGYKRWQIFFYRIMAKLTNKIVFHSNWARDELKKVYNYTNDSKFNVISHGNYNSVYENKVTREQARKYLNVDEHDKVFLFFGTIRPFKGINLLIENFIKLPDKKSKLFIVGSPICEETKKYAKKLEEKYSNTKNIIFFLKYIEEHKIQYFMNMADFIVLPYKHIFSSGCIMLALAFGRGIIVPSIDSIPEIIGGTQNILYDPYSENGLLNALKQALNTDSIKLGEKIFKLGLQEKYKWSYSAEQYKKIYMQCCR